MFKAYSCFLLILLSIFNVQVFADPLLLTPQEMQKLKKYFPSDDDNTHYTWKGDAIALTLPLNQEKRLIFPSKITPDLKGALTTDQLRIINDDKSLYLTAKKPFSDIRMYVTVQGSDKVILIDLSAKETEDKESKADNTAVYIDLSPTPKESNSQNLTTTRVNNSPESSSDTPVSDNDNYVTLIRFAWQQLYAPEVPLNNPLGIMRAPMHTAYFISTLIYGDKVTVHPIASWTDQNNYVTALELRNKYPHETSINISHDLCGDWQAATLYPRSVLMPSSNTDNTILFLISQKSFGEIMERCNGRA
jgi:integrating conjugative element protein (TIGR03749 family)